METAERMETAAVGTQRDSKSSLVSWYEFFERLASKGWTDGVGGGEYHYITYKLIARGDITDEVGQPVTQYSPGMDLRSFSDRLFITKHYARQMVMSYLPEFDYIFQGD